MISIGPRRAHAQSKWRNIPATDLQGLSRAGAPCALKALCACSVHSSHLISGRSDLPSAFPGCAMVWTSHREPRRTGWRALIRDIVGTA
jgi:hypothetical protein